MKWIEISKAKIEFNAPVFTKDKNGNFGLGKLMEQKHTAGGIICEFEMALFDGQAGPYFSIEITHVAKPK